MTKSSVRLFVEDCVLYRNIHSLQVCLVCRKIDLDSRALRLVGRRQADWHMKFNVAKCHSMRVTSHYSHKQILHDCTSKPWKMFSPQNILTCSQSQRTWIGVNISLIFFPKQLRLLASFTGTWLLHLGVPIEFAFKTLVRPKLKVGRSKPPLVLTGTPVNMPKTWSIRIWRHCIVVLKQDTFILA